MGWKSIGAEGATYADELAASECGFAFLVGSKWTEVIAGERLRYRSIDVRFQSHGITEPVTSDRPTDNSDCAVKIGPSDAVMRRREILGGMAAEFVQVTRYERMEFSFCAPGHLLAVYEQGERREGDTLVEGLPPSILRKFKWKLTFVPAGHEYYEHYEPRVLTQVMYLYLQPEMIPTPVEQGRKDSALAPRLFFEDTTLCNTALKLKRLLGTGNQPYLDALGVVLAHELVRLNAGCERIEAPARGGLAPWQPRIATSYIEEHLAEQISLASLRNSFA